MSDPIQTLPPDPGQHNWKTPLVAGAIAALLGANVYLYLQVDQLRTDASKFRETVLNEIASVRETSSVTTAAQRKHIETLKSELDSTRVQANQAASVAKSEALTRVDQVARKLSEEQQRQQQQVTGELSQVKQQATAANSKLAEVGGEVSTVKTEVASTKSELQKTIADLKRVTGDLGVQSGLIATNAKELGLLKRLGERNYFEFNLRKTKAPQRVGDVSVLIKKTDPKRNKYTIELIADDKTTEKRDKGINEPVQFYTSKARQPYELVVNQVKKDQIVGYLATPKDQVARN